MNVIKPNVIIIKTAEEAFKTIPERPDESNGTMSYRTCFGDVLIAKIQSKELPEKHIVYEVYLRRVHLPWGNPFCFSVRTKAELINDCEYEKDFLTIYNLAITVAAKAFEIFYNEMKSIYDQEK